MLGLDLGEALRESGGGLGLNMGVLTPSEALPTWVLMAEPEAAGRGWTPRPPSRLHPTWASSSPLQRNPEARGHWKLSYSQN